jgi:predicted HD superfamily hydrolase involved in NAD metabolism
MHDCAKNLDENSPLLQGFTPPQRVPAPVLHQYAGAFVAKNTLGVTDEDVLNAICYHTSGRENMSALEKLIFLADMLEEGRAYKEVDELRQAFFTRGLDEGLTLALLRSLEFLKEKGQSVYPLTQKAYEFMNNQRR